MLYGLRILWQSKFHASCQDQVKRKNYRERTPVHGAYFSYLKSTKGEAFLLKQRLQRKKAQRISSVKKSPETRPQIFNKWQPLIMLLKRPAHFKFQRWLGKTKMSHSVFNLYLDTQLNILESFLFLFDPSVSLSYAHIACRI